jgi:hypothetical protein
MIKTADHMVATAKMAIGFAFFRAGIAIKMARAKTPYKIEKKRFGTSQIIACDRLPIKTRKEMDAPLVAIVNKFFLFSILTYINREYCPNAAM